MCVVHKLNYQTELYNNLKPTAVYRVVECQQSKFNIARHLQLWQPSFKIAHSCSKLARVNYTFFKLKNDICVGDKIFAFMIMAKSLTMLVYDLHTCRG
jgi:hypothetical protein